MRLSLRNRADFPILQEIFIEQSYAPFLSELPEIKTWVDLGANCGFFSLYMEHHARDKGWSGPRQALLVEPNELCIPGLKESLALSGIDGFHVEQAAVASHPGEVAFFASKSTYKSSLYALGSKESSHAVKALDLEQATKFLGENIDLLKIDIEGGEKDLFEGWKPWLRRARAICLEWHCPHMSGKQADEILRGLGFQLVKVDPPAYLKGDPRPPLDLEIGTGLWVRK